MCLVVHMGWMAVRVWAAMVIDWVFRVLCFVGRYLAGTWRKNVVLWCQLLDKYFT